MTRRQSSRASEDVRPHFRASRKLLRAVERLHQLGYQKLRIYPMMNDAGSSWRCMIHPLNFPMDMLRPEVFSYTMAWIYKYFLRYDDETSFQHSSAAHVASAFEQRLPAMLRLATGRDPEYQAWYSSMLSLTDETQLPCVGGEGNFYYTVTYSHRRKGPERFEGPPGPEPKWR